MKHGWELVESDPLLRLLKPVFARVVFVLPVQQLSADIVFERFKYWKGTHYLGNGIFNQFSITIDTVIVLYLVWGNSYTMIMTEALCKCHIKYQNVRFVYFRIYLQTLRGRRHKLKLLKLVALFKSGLDTIHVDVFNILQLTVLLSFHTELDVIESFTSRASTIDILALDKRCHFAFE